MIKVRIINAPTVAPIWVGKIGVIKENSFDLFKGMCYNVEIIEKNLRIRLGLYPDEFERID